MRFRTNSTPENITKYVFYIESLEIFQRIQQTYREKVSCFVPRILKSATATAQNWAFPVLMNVSGEEFYGGYMNACNADVLNYSLLWFQEHRDVAQYIIPMFDAPQVCGIEELFRKEGEK